MFLWKKGGTIRLNACMERIANIAMAQVIALICPVRIALQRRKNK
tara:strand:- start:755 stop:889 length:135 start_codon:yes stop_codon:yes gene_type:complete